MPGTFCGWIFILVLIYIYIYTGFTLILRTTSLFFPDGQAGGQVAARSLRWSFLAKSEGGKERERAREAMVGSATTMGGERETKELALSTNSLAFSSFVNSDYEGFRLNTCLL